MIEVPWDVVARNMLLASAAFISSALAVFICASVVCGGGGKTYV
jgi:hypothetical protein